MAKIIVRVRATHPTGVRRRCGFTFGHKPSQVDVTAAEKKIIEADQYLLIVTKGLALEEGAKNPIKKGTTLTEDNTGDTEKKETVDTTTKEEETTGDTVEDTNGESEGAPETEGPVTEEDKQGKTEDEKETEEETLNEAKLMQKKQVELVAILEEKGMEAGKDFDLKAAKKDLAKLILAV